VVEHETAVNGKFDVVIKLAKASADLPSSGLGVHRSRRWCEHEHHRRPSLNGPLSIYLSRHGIFLDTSYPPGKKTHDNLAGFRRRGVENYCFAPVAGKAPRTL
jgi:hypothetical protein